MSTVQRTRQLASRASVGGMAANAGGYENYFLTTNAITLTNSFEGGLPWTRLAPGAGGNSGGVSGNYIDGVTNQAKGNIWASGRSGGTLRGQGAIGCGGSGLACASRRWVPGGTWRGSPLQSIDAVNFDPTMAHTGTQSMQVRTGNNGGGFTTVQEVFWWSTSMGPQRTIWFRMYLFMGAYPDLYQIQVFSIYNSSIGTTIALNMFGATGPSPGVFAAFGVVGSVPVPLGAWSRLEGFITTDPTAGYIGWSIYEGDSTQPLETLVGGPGNTDGMASGPSTMAYRFGLPAGPGSPLAGPWWIDDIAISSTGPLGPSMATAPAQGALGIVAVRGRGQIALARAPFAVGGGVSDLSNFQPVAGLPQVSIAPGGPLQAAVTIS